jgi:hypothetical protein
MVHDRGGLIIWLMIISWDGFVARLKWLAGAIRGVVKVAACATFARTGMKHVFMAFSFDVTTARGLCRVRDRLL